MLNLLLIKITTISFLIQCFEIKVIHQLVSQSQKIKVGYGDRGWGSDKCGQGKVNSRWNMCLENIISKNGCHILLFHCSVEDKALQNAEHICKGIKGNPNGFPAHALYMLNADYVSSCKKTFNTGLQKHFRVQAKCQKERTTQSYHNFTHTAFIQSLVLYLYRWKTVFQTNSWAASV